MSRTLPRLAAAVGALVIVLGGAGAASAFPLHHHHHHHHFRHFRHFRVHHINHVHHVHHIVRPRPQPRPQPQPPRLPLNASRDNFRLGAREAFVIQDPADTLIYSDEFGVGRDVINFDR